MAILLSVKCETAILFSVKRDEEPPIPPSFFRLKQVVESLENFSIKNSVEVKPSSKGSDMS